MKTRKWDRAAGMAMEAARERAAAIMARIKAGDSQTAVARELGITRQRVGAIVAREKARARA